MSPPKTRPELPVKQNKAYRVAMKHRPDRADGTPLEAYVSAVPRPAGEPVLVFQHIQKTSGTAIRQIMHRNYKREGVEMLIRDAPRQATDQTLLRAWYEDLHASLSRDQRAGLMAVACHSANHLLPLLDRPTRSFTMLREPVDRVLSRFFFVRPEQRPGTLHDLYRALDERERRFHFVNAQSKSLLAPHWDVAALPSDPGDPGAGSWRERLFAVVDEHYTVGLQARFVESVQLFARTLGWSDVFAPRVRVNRTRPRELEDPALRRTILDHNWLDIELYRRAFAAFPGG